VQAAEGYEQETCLKQQLARVAGCIIQEDAFLLAGGLDAKALIAIGSLPELNTTAVFTELAAIFSDSTVASRQESFASLKELTGITKTAKLTEEESRQRKAARNAVRLQAERDLDAGLSAVKARLGPRIESVERDLAALPTCTGCKAEWCPVKDIKQYRCCSIYGKCSKGRTKCDDKKGETCGGVRSIIRNMGPRECRCKAGNCWNRTEQACKQDASHEDRIRLVDDRKYLAKLKRLQNKWEDVSSREQEKAWEETVVKAKTELGTDEDAKPDPRYNGRWICSQ